MNTDTAPGVSPAEEIAGPMLSDLAHRDDAEMAEFDFVLQLGHTHRSAISEAR